LSIYLPKLKEKSIEVKRYGRSEDIDDKPEKIKL